MREYIELASTPYEEECAQVGRPDYRERAVAECNRLRDQLRRQFGEEPDGARLAIKGNLHDFGTYYELVCYYELGLEESIAYAMKCDNEFPAYWDDVALATMATME